MTTTTFFIYALMVACMALAAFGLPKLACQVKRGTVVLGCLPTFVLMVIGAHVESSGRFPGDFYAMGLMSMFICPLLAVFFDGPGGRRVVRAISRQVLEVTLRYTAQRPIEATYETKKGVS